MTDDEITRALRTLIVGPLGFAVAILVVVAGTVLLFQGALWLHDGFWSQLPAGPYVSPMLPEYAQAWLNDPQSWYGLHRVILYLLGLGVAWFLLALAAVLFVTAMCVSAAISRLAT